MLKITKENLESFLNYYHNFHDSTISNINYDIRNSKIEVIINVFWTGEPILKENGKYDTNPIKLKIVCDSIEKCSFRAIASWEYLDDVFVKYIVLNNKEYVCFASSEEEPFVYVLCDSMYYENIE